MSNLDKYIKQRGITKQQMERARLDTVRRYVEALGGHITLMADLPTGRVSLA